MHSHLPIIEINVILKMKCKAFVLCQVFMHSGFCSYLSNESMGFTEVYARCLGLLNQSRVELIPVFLLPGHQKQCRLPSVDPLLPRDVFLFLALPRLV